MNKIIISHVAINTYYDFDMVFEKESPIKNHIVEQDGTYTIELKEGVQLYAGKSQVVISYKGHSFDLESYEYAQVRIC